MTKWKTIKMKSNLTKGKNNMQDKKCDECQSENIGFVNNDWLCLECGEKIDEIKLNKGEK